MLMFVAFDDFDCVLGDIAVPALLMYGLRRYESPALKRSSPE
jgi:hypothetical protein